MGFNSGFKGLNGISRDHNIFPLKPGFRLIKVHYIQYKKLNQDMQTLNWTEKKYSTHFFFIFSSSQAGFSARSLLSLLPDFPQTL